MRIAVIASFLLLIFLRAHAQTVLDPAARAQPAADIRFPALITHPGPQGLDPSPWYTVAVSQRGVERRSFVYMVNNIGLAQNNWQQHAWNDSTELTTSFTSFDFNDPGATFDTPGVAPVIVRVTMPIPALAWRSPAVRILPSASNIVPSRVVQVDGTYQASFEIHFATQYSVEFYDAAAAPDFANWVPSNPLLIFANPLEHDVPRSDAPNVRVLRPGDPIPVAGSWGTRRGVAIDTLVFTPGIYDLGQVPSSVNTGIYVLHSDQTIYITGGAYIKGAFVSCPTPTRCSDAKRITIRGRGILSGENFNRPYNGVSFESLSADLPAVVQLQGSDIVDGQFNGQRQAHIEGVTIVQAPFDNIYLSGIDNWVDNVKVISWYPNTDGIKAGNDYEIDGVEHPGRGRVENSFLKDGDDSIHLYSSGLRVNNVVIWQSKNASPFEFSSGLSGSIDDVRVTHSNVIHTEWTYPNMANAVFAANLGGQGNKGYDLGYTFDDIHVENSGWQLCRLSIVPTIWQFGNTQLGSLSNVHFHDIFVKDPQALPSLFKSYDRVHRISNVTFDNVIVAGEAQSQPRITFDANRSMSLSGDIVTEPLWIDSSGPVNPNAQIWDMRQGEPTTSPVTAVKTLDERFLNDPALKLLRRGDFFGDGFASPLIFDPADAALDIWAEPLNPNSTFAKLGDYTAATIPAGYQFAGVGDFTGDGISGVLLWNAPLQKGLILTMQGSGLTIRREFEPSNQSSTWRVAGIGDFDLNGVSDVLLRDANGNLEILYQDPAGVTKIQDLSPSQLAYSATPLFKQNDPTLPPTGEFDSSWTVAGVGAVNNYAAILWINDRSEIGLTQFVFPAEKPYGKVIATLPSGMQLQGLGDYNGDGSIDMLLHDPSTGEVAFWYMGFLAGNYYQPAPATGVEISGAWQN